MAGATTRRRSSHAAMSVDGPHQKRSLTVGGQTYFGELLEDSAQRPDDRSDP